MAKSVKKPVTKKRSIKPLKKTSKAPPIKSVTKWRYFEFGYQLFGLIILVATTVLWAVLGARVHQSNADQLVDPYLFDSKATFEGAHFPGAHSMLLKWPLFLLVRVLGYTPFAFTFVTVITVLLTVLTLAFCLYKTDRRPLVFGTLCLALASVLLMVPTLPYSSGLLPVNMAMLATRNLEYALYLFCLVQLIRSPHLKSWRFWLSASLLGVLVASDKIFLAFSLGGSLLAFVCYAMFRLWKTVSLAVRWVVLSAVSLVLALSLLKLAQAIGPRVSDQVSASPYTISQDPKTLLLAAVYTALGILTNFGVNPAVSATVLSDYPRQAIHTLASIELIPLSVNLVILGVGILAAYKLLIYSLGWIKAKRMPSLPLLLSILLIWSTVAAIAVFMVSNHYYAVDARYLTISLFAIFISLAAYASTKELSPRILLLFGGILSLSVLVAGTVAFGTYHDQKKALAEIDSRNKTVTQVLKSHKVDVLVGDYWRTIPTKFTSGTNLQVNPLGSCTQPRSTLTTKAWQTDLKSHSFAYLLSLDKSLTDFPQCKLSEVVKTYGRPNASALISGSLAEPKEQLLFYDHGIRHPTTTKAASTPATVVPIPADQLPNTNCDGPTIVNAVAHQDDDLLFMNPDLQHDLDAGHCIRSIYLTSGDAGHDKFYWLKREQGIEAAYSMMLGSQAVWVERIVKLTDTAYVTVANPSGNHKVSLIFLHLPDGGLSGQGFIGHDQESLSKLESGGIPAIHSVDKESSYTSMELVAGLVKLMNLYHPSEIRTQADVHSSAYPDHSDHVTTGAIVAKARDGYVSQQFENKVAIPLKYYTGYPIREMPENVTELDLQKKSETFFEYAKFDTGVCGSFEACSHVPTYDSYLRRQYAN